MSSQGHFRSCFDGIGTPNSSVVTWSRMTHPAVGQIVICSCHLAWADPRIVLPSGSAGYQAPRGLIIPHGSWDLRRFLTRHWDYCYKISMLYPRTYNVTFSLIIPYFHPDLCPEGSAVNGARAFLQHFQRHIIFPILVHARRGWVLRRWSHAKLGAHLGHPRGGAKQALGYGGAHMRANWPDRHKWSHGFGKSRGRRVPPIKVLLLLPSLFTLCSRFLTGTAIHPLWSQEPGTIVFSFSRPLPGSVSLTSDPPASWALPCRDKMPAVSYCPRAALPSSPGVWQPGRGGWSAVVGHSAPHSGRILFIVPRYPCLFNLGTCPCAQMSSCPPPLLSASRLSFRTHLALSPSPVSHLHFCWLPEGRACL